MRAHRPAGLPVMGAGSEPSRCVPVSHASAHGPSVTDARTSGMSDVRVAA